MNVNINIQAESVAADLCAIAFDLPVDDEVNKLLAHSGVAAEKFRVRIDLHVVKEDVFTVSSCFASVPNTNAAAPSHDHDTGVVAVVGCEVFNRGFKCFRGDIHIDHKIFCLAVNDMVGGRASE